MLTNLKMKTIDLVLFLRISSSKCKKEKNGLGLVGFCFFLSRVHAIIQYY